MSMGIKNLIPLPPKNVLTRKSYYLILPELSDPEDEGTITLFNCQPLCAKQYSVTYLTNGIYFTKDL